MGAGSLSDTEIKRSLPLWIALSETFLDTELTDDTYRFIAETITAGGFGKEEALAIYRQEVAPAFAANLLAPAGVCAGWRDEYVRQKVIEARASWARRMLVRLVFKTYVQDEWDRISAFL